MTNRESAHHAISDEHVEAIIVKTLETTPPGETHWSTRSMAKAAGVSHTMVGRIWRTFRLQPHRTESLKLSPSKCNWTEFPARVMFARPVNPRRTAGPESPP